MTPLIAAARLLGAVNGAVLGAGRMLGVLAIAAMVAATLLQVFCRYVLGNALPWPDEAARFCMLWMTGLMAPQAFRAGGFVAIDTFDTLLPGRGVQALQLVFLAISLAVLVIAARIGLSEVTGIGGRFATASLYLPVSWGLDQWYRVPRSWMMASLLVGVWLLILVNIELMLRRVLALLGHEGDLPEIAGAGHGGAE
ncbi:TRAP transporter small permease [Mangrovicoccus algicola]|uniref:TRAP transporter small permease protein n=1 Tax=Mangrovicoccus algicola TaxID=2771008 RepID=A0A8J6YVH6_9RHOB|nr:TRAP transporter small permease [Mangrovicoccus algicola]MBE3638392.1 TRAP transporter small permease [Mangrovicoccus algicola]